jgi:hypothetical protein
MMESPAVSLNGSRFNTKHRLSNQRLRKNFFLSKPKSVFNGFIVISRGFHPSALVSGDAAKPIL